MTDLHSGPWASGTLLAPSPPEPPLSTPSTTADGLDWLRALDWRQFEELVGRAYQGQGYQVLPTAHGADGGIDLILTRGTERIFVQCKHWRSSQVGVQVARELFGLVSAHQATWGVVATSGRFTAEAKEFAHHARLTLLDGPAVAQLIALGQTSQRSAGPPLNQDSPIPAPVQRSTEPTCPICASAMKLRTARRGPDAGSKFWGCSRYPGCKGIRPAPQTSPVAAASRTIGKPRPRLAVVLARLAPIPLAVLVVFGGIQLMGNILTSNLTKASTPVVTIPSTGTAVASGEQPMDITFNALNNLIYTANYGSGDVTIVNAKTLAPTGRINVPGKPIAIAADPNHHRLYVADGAAAKIYLVDTSSGKTTTTLTLTAKATDVALDAGRQRLFVVSSTGKSLAVFSTTSLSRLGQVPTLGHPSSVAVDTANHTVYVQSDLLVTPYTEYLTRRTALPLLGGAHASLAVDSTQTKLYSLNGRILHEYNLQTGQIRTLDPGVDAGSVCINPAKHVAYLAYPDTDKVAAIRLK
jgi:YVTN family beta-propeller protein